MRSLIIALALFSGCATEYRAPNYKLASYKAEAKHVASIEMESASWCSWCAKQKDLIRDMKKRGLLRKVKFKTIPRRSKVIPVLRITSKNKKKSVLVGYQKEKDILHAINL